MRQKLILTAIFLVLTFSTYAQKFFVEKADGGSEKVIIDKLLEENIQVTFKEDSADYTLKSNIKKMSLGRAKGNILIIENKTGNLYGKTTDTWGSARLVNGYDNPVADVLRRICKKSLMALIAPLKRG
ncbi:hypothetical protein AAHN97_15205 [Chitinophaga niabensis]|uniref:hypothetical protein n=1 Tax=Chitinophaga niabensis TaxID=536979 RepID=UPI0031BBC75C